ncbi:MAG: ATP-grasp domain-containing protein, partial [Gammaproteobacteria bacterium]
MSITNTNQPDFSAARYGKVAVLCGGTSAEREISMESGKAVHAALTQRGIDTRLLDTGTYAVSRLVEEGFDRAFIALHGRGGEDGTVQGALESLAIPYTGSGVLGSALAMDKVRSKWIWAWHGLSTPAFMEVERQEDLSAVAGKLKFPLMVKPVNEGSSYGASRVEDAARLEQAWLQARELDPRVMCEEWVSGAEYTIGIVQE